MEPLIWNPRTGGFGEEHEAEAKRQSEGGGLLASSEPAAPEAARTEAGHEETAAPYGETGFNLAHAAEKSLGGHTAAEWLFIIISLLVAGIGIGLGLLFYVYKPALPDTWAARLGPIYWASYNKYWVDELYGALLTRRTMDAARGVYAFDSKVIDGAVNGSAWLTRLSSLATGLFDKYVVDGLVNTIAGFISNLMSPLIRAAQTGLTANYALVMVLGLVIAVVLFFGGDILSAMRSMFAALI
jgi:NADH:ubiquinone oxidoreductase subunit 5 (subunit L)/multisubunit Na+/H+ antiporter MnhA subunit